MFHKKTTDTLKCLFKEFQIYFTLKLKKKKEKLLFLSQNQFLLFLKSRERLLTGL